MAVYLGSNRVCTQGGTKNITGGISLQSKTVSPSESSQTVTADSSYDGLSQVTINAVSNTYVGSGVTKKSATTYTPSTSNQTIASGTYLSGTQTIKGDSNLVASNIKSGVSIFGVSGSYTASGGSGLDTSDATAQPKDIVKGYTAYANGQKITGTINEITGALGTTAKTISSSESNYIQYSYTFDLPYAFRASSSVSIKAAMTEFGDATASDVVAGKTFTSASGLKVTGTHQCSGSSGTDTSDATASASDILSGKTAYVKGSKVTGTIASQAAQTITPGTSDKTIASGKYLSGTQTIKGDANLVAANIKSGVSIFGVAGSYTGSSSSGSSTNNCEAYHITSTSATINFQGSGTVKVFGYGAKKSTYTTTIYSFVGDGYYTGTSYGTPSKTTASFSVSGGTLSGLPSGLTAVDLLVVIGV